MSKDTVFSVPLGREERLIVRKIAQRAMRRYQELGQHHPVVQIEMDIQAVHQEIVPLRLADLLAANDFNFMHDIDGIRNCLNRSTITLEGYFVPRFVVRKDDRDTTGRPMPAREGQSR